MTDRIDDNVGKKIVEALKMQDQTEDTADIAEEEYEDSFDDEYEAPVVESDDEQLEDEQSDEEPVYESPTLNFNQPSTSFVDNAFQQSLERNLGIGIMSDSIEYPANIEVLKQLIGKLPAGVSKQTGALIIQQTMEALGISMKSVISEARQVQSELSSGIRECQANIVDYRKQITALENRAQQYQKQFAMLNDIISLFIHSVK